MYQIAPRARLGRFPVGQHATEWLRGLDSNQDNQLQRLACYQLHYLGIGFLERVQLLTHWTCWAEFGQIGAKYSARLCQRKRGCCATTATALALAMRFIHGGEVFFGIAFG